MLTVLLVIQAIIAISMVILIIIQRSSSDGLAGLSGGSGGNSLLSGRASANILTKSTTILAALFMINSLAMATITARQGRSSEPLFEQLPDEKAKNESAPLAPTDSTATPADQAVPITPAAPAEPLVPRAE
jgi:preprotein translocase subunit SecG